MSSKLEFKELTSNNEVEPRCLYKLAAFTQAWFYGEWQEASHSTSSGQVGKKVRRFAIYEGSEPILYMQLIPCPLAKGRIYYTIPYGPIVKNLEAELLSLVFDLLKSELRKIMEEDNAVFTRLDFSPSKILSYKTHILGVQPLKRRGWTPQFVKARWWSVHGACFQPRVEWWLPLEATEEEILKEMHQKTRYNIRLAEKKGVEVEIVEENLADYLEDFYKVQSITATRNGFQLHEKEYYEAVLTSAEHNKNGYLVVAKYKGEILTINFVINYGSIAMFVFGGSSNEHRNLMPSYLVQWEGAKHAKALGMQYYNFGGYFDEDGPRLKKATLAKRSGFSIFKRKFGGRAEVHGDFYDCVGKPLWYTLYLIHKFLRHV